MYVSFVLKIQFDAYVKQQQQKKNNNSYSDVHGYVALVVCIFGCIANSLNIIVLTRHEMRS